MPQVEKVQSSASRTVVISAWMPKDLVAALKARADESDRSFSAELRQAIRSYLGRVSR